MTVPSRPTAQCTDCGYSLPIAEDGPCPACGSTRRTVAIAGQATIKIEATATLRWTRTREYFENHPLSLMIVIGLTVLASVVGLLVAGLTGAIIGFTLSVIALVVGFGARIKVREIEHGGGR